MRLPLVTRANWLAGLVLVLLGAIVWAQGTDRTRFETHLRQFELGAGWAREVFWVNITRDRFNGATLYTITRERDGGVEVMAHSAVGAPLGTGEPIPNPTPIPTPCPTPDPNQIPNPPACLKSYGASLRAEAVVGPSTVTVTYSGSWLTPPIEGWLSDHAIPLNQSSLQMGETVTWIYPRTECAQTGFGFLSLVRDDGTRCDVVAVFEVPAM